MASASRAKLNPPERQGRRAAGGRLPARAALRAGGRWAPSIAIALLVMVLGADVMRIGFFADDFHFLDVARRVPLLNALSGAHGLYPWYRPLSREAYFALVALFGPFKLAAAHALSLACVGFCAWQLRAIGSRLLGPRAAAIAPVLFLTYAITKFLAAWPSGFQDLLALLLMLLAVRAQLEGRGGRAALWAFLAVFAKETAVIVFPLLAIEAWVLGRERQPRRWLLWQGGALGAALAIHVLARLAWHGSGSLARVKPSFVEIAAALGRVLAGFAGFPASSELTAFGMAALAMIAAGILLMGEWRTGTAGRPVDEDVASRPTIMRCAAFLGLAIALGVSPMVLGHLSTRARANEYYAFAAAPWLALALAAGLARLPRSVGIAGVVVLAGWNTLALGYRPVDLDVRESWRFDRWDWPQAIRLSAIAERLQEDVRVSVPSRPESLVVLLGGMENGCYFQTEDGPATRESLQDPTARSFWLYKPPYGLQPGAFEILVFNPETRHLERHQLPPAYRYELATDALAVGNAPAAWALASYGDSAENSHMEFGYLRVAAALVQEGADAARRVLQGAGLADTSGLAPDTLAMRSVGAASSLRAPLAQVLGRPLDARTHLALAEAYGAAGMPMLEAMELRLATSLDPALAGERLRMDRLLLLAGKHAPAREDLARVAKTAAGTPVAAAAQWLLDHAPPAPEEDQSEAGIR
jgi:hypothetical protein